MWNWLVSSLSLGATIVLYDGNPFFPNQDRLLEMASSRRINVFGTSAKYIDSLRLSGSKPGDRFNFDNLDSILSTGSPLNEENFQFVYDYWKKVSSYPQFQEELISFPVLLLAIQIYLSIKEISNV